MNTIDFLKSHEKPSSGAFVSEAQFLNDNWYWLKYSYSVAVRVAGRLAELKWTQKQLAQALGCTQQHVSSLLNGKVNMTLETLAKLEIALDIDLIGNLLSPYSVRPRYDSVLNEPSSESEVYRGKTSHLVEGYSPRKKKGPKSGCK